MTKKCAKCKFCKNKLQVWTNSGDLTDEVCIGICKKCEKEMLKI